ncbi:MAG: hypothetical protein Q7S65_01970 [Nanoarchaeota archaeon]|nr:hypothetical protein [Nanoarchaeota archaeon]
MLSSKKAQNLEAMWWLIDLIAFAFITVAVFNFIGGLGDSTTFQRTYLSRDLSLLLDTLPALPGSVSLQYPRDLSTFTVRVQEDEVQVSERGSTDAARSLFLPDYKIPALSGEFVSDAKDAKQGWLARYLPVAELLKTPAKDRAPRHLWVYKDSTSIRLLDRESAASFQHACHISLGIERKVAVLAGTMEAEAGDERVSSVSSDEASRLPASTLLLTMTTHIGEPGIWILYDPSTDSASTACRMANAALRIWPEVPTVFAPVNREELRTLSGLSEQHSAIVVELSLPSEPDPAKKGVFERALMREAVMS